MVFLAHCREDNYCNYWTYEENLETNDDRRCSLMTSCEKTSVAPYPVLTTSGGQDCKPEPVKRRKCSGCPQERPFCHGRAVFTGRSVPFWYLSLEKSKFYLFKKQWSIIDYDWLTLNSFPIILFLLYPNPPIHRRIWSVSLSVPPLQQVSLSDKSWFLFWART